MATETDTETDRDQTVESTDSKTTAAKRTLKMAATLTTPYLAVLWALFGIAVKLLDVIAPGSASLQSLMLLTLGGIVFVGPAALACAAVHYKVETRYNLIGGE
jgi:hypothetical protein